MKVIKIKEVIDRNGLDFEETAKHLFPRNKYPRLALNRVIAGEAVLDADQISKLSLLSGVAIEDLFSGNWEVQRKPGKIVIQSEDYRAELDTESWITSVFHKKSLIHESVIHSGSISLQNYIDAIETVINKYKLTL